jgi:hypothetical protein
MDMPETWSFILEANVDSRSSMRKEIPKSTGQQNEKIKSEKEEIDKCTPMASIQHGVHLSFLPLFPRFI